PSPRFAIDQVTAGPFSGHCLSSPVSLDRPLRSGPRHCGHSASGAVLPTVIVSKAKVQNNANENKNFIASLLICCRLCGLVGLPLRLKPSCLRGQVWPPLKR